MSDTTNSDNAFSKISDAKQVIGGQVVGTRNTTGKYAVGKGIINVYEGGSSASGYSSASIPTRKDIIQKPAIFRGEKPIFVGRQDYIEQIREYLKTPGI